MRLFCTVAVAWVLAGAALAQEPYECSYFRKGAPDPVVVSDCLTLLPGANSSAAGPDALISAQVIAGAFYDENGIGFFDATLSIVVAPRYDFAFPFDRGRSVVCSGCRKQKSGEHTLIVGGKWGAIDRQGNVVKPLAYSKAELESLLK